MVKTPSTRHSKSGRETVTIDQQASEAKITASAGDGGPFEGSPSGSAATFEETKGTDLGGHPKRSPATRAGETHSDEDRASAASTPLQSERSSGDEALIAAHADAPALRVDEAEQAPASTVPFAADRTDDSAGHSAVEPSPGESMTAASAAASNEGDDRRTSFGSRDAAGSSVPGLSGADAAPARRGAGFGSLLAAGVVGGALALGGSYLLDQAGIGRAPQADTAQTADVEALRTEVAALRESAGNTDNTDYGAAIEQLRSEVAAVGQNSADGAASEEVGALSARVDELGTQLQALSQQTATANPPVDLGPLNGRVDAVEQAVRSVEQAADQSRSATEQRLGEMQAALDALGQRLEERVNDPRLALAITASALKAAIDRGQPFQTELDAYAAAAPNSPGIDTLRPLAESGVPTRGEIVSDLPDAAGAMVAAAKPVPENPGMVARLWSSASNLVDVRPVGENIQGNEPGAIVARLEAAVKAGDFAKALAEYESLPEPAKAAGADFAAKLRARQTADDLVGTALAEALKA
jgi:hypothetical protein